MSEITNLDRFYIFLQGKHKRLGETSLVSTLPNDIIEKIYYEVNISDISFDFLIKNDMYSLIEYKITRYQFINFGVSSFFLEACMLGDRKALYFCEQNYADLTTDSIGLCYTFYKLCVKEGITETINWFLERRDKYDFLKCVNI